MPDRRLLEDGSARLLEDGSARLLEQPSEFVTGITTYVGWRGLQQIYRAAAADHAAEQARGLIACPRCGEPLDRARGVLHCPFDGSTYPVG